MSPTSLRDCLRLLLNKSLTGASGVEHVLVAIDELDFPHDEVCGRLVDPASSVVVVMVDADTVEVLHAEVLAITEGLGTDRVCIRRGQVVVDCPRWTAFWMIQNRFEMVDGLEYKQISFKQLIVVNNVNTWFETVDGSEYEKNSLKQLTVVKQSKINVNSWWYK